jgi:hypothetical protein
VPGSNPAEAVREYTTPLQQSISCYTKAVIRTSGCNPDLIETVTFPQVSVDVLTVDGEILWLSFAQTFSVAKANWLGKYKVTTRSYMYSIENDDRQEILAFHWHPESASPIKTPHMHIGPGAGNTLRQEVRNAHFPTSRIAFEEFCLILLQEFKLVPERNDAADVLARNLEIFRNYKTW